MTDNALSKISGTSVMASWLLQPATVRKRRHSQTALPSPCIVCGPSGGFADVDEQSKCQVKEALLQYDRSLLVADPRRCEPKK